MFATATAVGDTAAALADLGLLSAADVHVAEATGRLTGETDPEVLLAAALAARAPRQGHVAVRLDTAAEQIAAATEEPAQADAVTALPWPEPGEWIDTIASSPAAQPAAASEETTPLVVEDGRVYLDRYWQYETRLADQLTRRSTRIRDDVDTEHLRDGLDGLFPPTGTDEVDRQRLAAALTALRDLTVLSGPPGTGKTTTVVRILALLLRVVQPPTDVGALRIALAAPTGKAAVRMQQAIRGELADLDVSDEIRIRLAELSAQTLHRLLGWRSRNTTRFRHDADNPLPYDVIVVDEASMASLPLMAKLLDAVPSAARLLLVGDHNQLASVDAGSVLGDICHVRPARGPGSLQFSGPLTSHLAPLLDADLPEAGADPGIRDSIVHLNRFHRFGEHSGIGAIARAIQDGEDRSDRVLAYLQGRTTETDTLDTYDDVSLAAGGGEPSDELLTTITAGYAPAVQAARDGADPADVLSILDRHRVLCALRRGPQGVAALNDEIQRRLASHIPGLTPHHDWYVGRPVMVTTNDYGIRLFNGDVGVVVSDPDDPGKTAVAFPTTAGDVRLLSPSRIPPSETVFATTIHKAQGSQFDHVFVVLPTVPSPILTRELLYTAVTRATDHVTVVATADILRATLDNSINRTSGLQAKLQAHPQ